MSFRPIPQAPTRQPLTRPDGTLSAGWQKWLDQIPQYTHDIRARELTINPSSVSANSTSKQRFSLSGTTTDDIVIAVEKPTHTSGLLIVEGIILASDNIDIIFANITGSPIDPGSETYKAVILKQ